ncbi:hypothetical protein WR25_05635 [Diploscapter pachys]|uniref:C-type lectin domain-containing protein n=1 Tax=Diploscapter pachys TaxID=2018661 RepID=A0A2A2JR59_9BILA|nr:hypothetical protein WR25_05635 [Diploscapter pachys]
MKINAFKVCVEHNATNATASHRDANANRNNHIYDHRSYRYGHCSYRYYHQIHRYNYQSYRYDHQSYYYNHQSYYYDHNSNNDYNTTRLTHYMRRFIINEVAEYVMTDGGPYSPNYADIHQKTIGSGGNYYTMDQYKAGACNTFHTGAEPASFTSQEQWEYLVSTDGKIAVDKPLWIGLEFDAAGNLAWINGQPVTWVYVPAALGNTGMPGFAFGDTWEAIDPTDPNELLDRTIICRAPPP